MQLSAVRWPKRKFDPFEKSDLVEYKFFLDKSQWRNNCPFELEWPYLTIPEMIRDKLINNYIKTMIEKASDGRSRKRNNGNHAGRMC
jgi:hypothetical protein